MSIKVMSAIFDAKIDDGEKSSASAKKLVLLAMGDFAADDGTGVYPSRGTLQDKTELSSGSLSYALKSLKKDRLIGKFGVTKWKTIVYALNITKIKKLARPEKIIPSMVEEFKEDIPSTIEDTNPQPLRAETSTIEENPSGIRQVNHQFNLAASAAASQPSEPELQNKPTTAPVTEESAKTPKDSNSAQSCPASYAPVTAKPEVVNTPTPKITHVAGVELVKPIDPNGSPSDQYRAKAAKALDAGLARQQSKDYVDLSWLREDLRPLAQTFCDISGARPMKCDQSLWCKELNFWQDLGLKTETIRAAYQKLVVEDHLTCAGPESLTKTARAIVNQVRATATSTGPVDVNRRKFRNGIPVAS